MGEGSARRRSGAHYESAVPQESSSPLDGIMELPAWSGPADVMVEALTLVQRDLDAAGLARYVMSHAVAGGSLEYPIVNVQWRGTWTSDSIDLDADDLARLTADVAAQAVQGLVELEGVYWPICPTHGVRTHATADHRGRAVWDCKKRGASPHVVSAIGDLGHLTERGTPEKSLWRTLNELASP
jgi:hypothetical protein